MTMKVLLIGGIAIASAIPANAQDLPRPEVPEQHAGPTGGIRIEEASNGFQLVEHGFWQSSWYFRIHIAGLPNSTSCSFAHVLASPRNPWTVCRL